MCLLKYRYENSVADALFRRLQVVLWFSVFFEQVNCLTKLANITNLHFRGVTLELVLLCLDLDVRVGMAPCQKRNREIILEDG